MLAAMLRRTAVGASTGAALALALSLSWGCGRTGLDLAAGDDGGVSAADAGPDHNRDLGHDAGVDGGADVRRDAGIDAGPAPCHGPSGPPLAFVRAPYCAAGNTPWDVIAADFDGDGRADLAVTDFSSNQVWVYLGRGDGTFVTTATLAVAAAPTSLAAADLNGDGAMDLVVGHESDTDAVVSVLLGDGRGGFAAERRVAVGTWPRAVAAADLDGDGRVDLAVGDGSDNVVTILPGNGDGSFGRGVEYPGGAAPESVAIVDWNRDGRPDIAVSDQNGGMTILLAESGGGYINTASEPANLNGGQVVAGDLDCDGNDELLAADMHTTAGGVAVIRGGASPGAQLYASAAGPFGLTVADLDGDGRLDVVAASPESFAGDAALVAYLGNGDGTLGPAQSLVRYALRNVYPNAIAAADFDGDGRADLAVANRGGLIAILLNRSGDLTPAPPPAATGSCGARAPGGIHPLIAVATGQDDPFGVAVDDHDVYWTNFAYPDFTGGTVMQAPKPSGAAAAAPFMLADQQGSPGDIAVDATHVYWANYNGNAIERAPISIGGASLLTEAGGTPTGLQIDAERVFWGNPAGRGGGSFISFGVLATPLDGGSHQVLCCDDRTVWALASDADNLYVAAGDILVLPKTGSASGGVPATLAVDGRAYYGVAVDAQNVYWTALDSTGTAGRLMVKSLAGDDPPRPLASGLDAPSAVISDGNNVYWLNASLARGAVLRIPVAGGAATEIAWGQLQPVRLTADATHLYWTNRTGGEVMSMAK
jgi:hypothetical protein